MANFQDELKAIALASAQESLRDEYLETADPQTIEERGLGRALSQWAEYGRSEVLAVAYYALVWGNHHTEAAQLKKLFPFLG